MTSHVGHHAPREARAESPSFWTLSVTLVHGLTLALASLPLVGCGFLWPYPEADGDTAAPSSPDAGVDAAFDCADATFFGAQPDADGGGLVVGRVVAPSGEVPVAGAEVTFGDGSAWVMSAEAGCFAIRLSPGTHTVSVAKGRYEADDAVTVEAGVRVDLGDLALDDGGLRVAVIDGDYDSVELLLTHLGLPYDALAEADDVFGRLGRYDAVFANCGSRTTRRGDAYDPADLAAMRAWIEAGGTLYASDLEWALFAGVAPEALEFGPTLDDVLRGSVGTIDATVLNRDVAHLLGTDRTEITFDLPFWAVVEGPGAAEVVVQGDVDGQTRPLAALHRVGAGRAVFTSFHNDHQATQDMQTILYELILAL